MLGATAVGPAVHERSAVLRILLQPSEPLRGGLDTLPVAGPSAVEQGRKGTVEEILSTLFQFTGKVIIKSKIFLRRAYILEKI